MRASTDADVHGNPNGLAYEDWRVVVDRNAVAVNMRRKELWSSAYFRLGYVPSPMNVLQPRPMKNGEVMLTFSPRLPSICSEIFILRCRNDRSVLPSGMLSSLKRERCLRVATLCVLAELSLLVLKLS